jgi:hypothetical protein
LAGAAGRGTDEKGFCVIVVPNNWAELQHYKDRSPPWIKLHKKLLDNYDYQRLPVASRALAPMLWLLASEHDDGEIDAAPEKLAFRLRMTEEEAADALQPLMDKGFFSECKRAASKPLAKLRAVARPETEKSREERDSLSAAKLPPCPHQELIALFGKHLPMLSQPKPELWKGKKADAMKARWVWALTTKSSKTDQLYATDAATALAFFERYFAYVSKSDFLTGRSGAWTGCSLEWLMTEANFAKALEGQYENKAAA